MTHQQLPFHIVIAEYHNILVIQSRRVNLVSAEVVFADLLNVFLELILLFGSHHVVANGAHTKQVCAK